LFILLLYYTSISNMEPVPFLKEIASILLQPGAYDLSSTCVVFPNKRARLFLSKYLGELTTKPVWAPRYLTITELMEKVSGYLYADRLTLLFELFKVYREVTGSHESFDTFYPYSETLLADFDEIDKYLVNANDLFSNLAGLKSLEGRFSYLTEEQIALIQRFWKTFDPANISEGQKTFLSLWDVLPDLYAGLKNNLDGQKIAYEGMAYRKAVKNLYENTEIPELGFMKYLFVGFNALNKCEDKLFRYLKNMDRAEFFWDYDSWYTNNEVHEAGFFIRNNLKNFPQAKPVNHENLVTNRKHVFFIPVASNTGQAGTLPLIFNTLGLKGQVDKHSTALVLADENLLIPVIYAIPGDITEVNVTMGYPLAGSAVFSLIDSLYQLFRNARPGLNGETTWYFRDVLTILEHPLLKSSYHEFCEPVREKIIRQNLIFLRVKDILQDYRNDNIFKELTGPTKVSRFLLDIIDDIMRQITTRDNNNSSSDPLQLEALFQVYTMLTRLQDILNVHQITPGPDTLFRLIRKILRTMHLPFSGEPLAGLQVLGLLETRTLDFDNVIMLSANEGILPPVSDVPSFIPNSIRSGFDLPTTDHYDSIYAYYFYRLIQRARNVALVYDCSTGGLRTGERSRFLHQIFYERPFPVKEITPPAYIARIPVKPIIIDKTGNVASQLSQFTGINGKPLSPSGLNEFLNCPLKFYFHHIAGLPQREEVAEEIDARLFGNILHKALKIIYTPFGNSLVSREKLESLLKDNYTIDNALDKAFNEVLFGQALDHGHRKIEGYNLIIQQVLRIHIRKLIETEMESGLFRIEGLEEKYIVSIPVNIKGKEAEIRIGGIIDRVDRREENILILDYKTGTVKNNFNSVESLFDAGEKLRNEAVFQVLLYACIYDTLHPGNVIIPGLYFIRASHSRDFSFNIKHGSKREMLNNYASVKQEFETLLQFHLCRLFDEDEPFKQTDNLKICGFCTYAGICRRD